MRIAYVLTTLAVGGAERQVLAIAERMAARSHAVALLVLKQREPNQLNTDLQVLHLDLRKTLAGFLEGRRRAIAFLRGFRPDIVHSHNFHGNMLARLARASVPDAKLISTIHNVYEGGRMRMLAYRLTDRYADLNTAVSEAVADRFVRMRAVPPAKCIVVRNGIDIAQFTPDPRRRSGLREQMGVADQFVWFTAGRISPAKDYRNLLLAFSKVRAEFPTSRLWIAGGCRTTRDEKYLHSLMALSPLQVEWLGARTDIPALLDAADGFVLGSAWEGMPLALGEAMAMEKPVAATDVGGVCELVGDAGTVAPAKNPGALAEAMLSQMRMSPIERTDMGRRARQCIVDHFNIDRKVDQWEALYSSMLR
jgi:glycosyltransferase involved in cell wall biosynthesis